MIVISESVFREICSEKDVSILIHDKIGCPLCSSLGESLALAMEQVVQFNGCTYDLKDGKSTITFYLGPSIKSNKVQSSSLDSSN